MEWKPTRLTREQVEERRVEAARLLRRGKLTQAEIAYQLGVSRMAVSQWATRLEAGGMRQLRQRRSCLQNTAMSGKTTASYGVSEPP